MNMKFNPRHFIFYFGLSWVLLGFLGAEAMARETYAAFVARMAAKAVSENDVRVDLEAQLLAFANQYRSAKGLKRLANDDVALPAARAHAMDMMVGKFMGHVASTGHDFDSRMRALKPGVLMLPQMAENAARVSRPGDVDAAMAAGLFQQWVKSTSHRHTLLSRDYVKVATGVVSRGGVLYADMIFTGPEAKTNMQIEIGNGLY